MSVHELTADFLCARSARQHRTRSLTKLGRVPVATPFPRVEFSKFISLLSLSVSIHGTRNLYKAVPRLRERCRQVETKVVSNGRNKILQTWDRPHRDSLYFGLIAAESEHCEQEQAAKYGLYFMSNWGKPNQTIGFTGRVSHLREFKGDALYFVYSTCTRIIRWLRGSTQKNSL